MKHSPGFLRLTNAAKKRIKQITVRRTIARLARGERFHLIDVREDHEWNEGHAAGAIHLSKGVIERDIEKMFPNKKTEMVLYCGGGFRSALAADNLQKMGYRNVSSMMGGWKAWKRLGGKIEG